MFSIHEKKVLILYFCHKKMQKNFFQKISSIDLNLILDLKLLFK